MPLKPVDSNHLYKSTNVHIYQTSTLGEKEYLRPATYMQYILKYMTTVSLTSRLIYSSARVSFCYCYSFNQSMFLLFYRVFLLSTKKRLSGADGNRTAWMLPISFNWRVLFEWKSVKSTPNTFVPIINISFRPLPFFLLFE